jgi:hypothetical protein
MTPKEKAIELTGIYLESTKKSLDRIGWFYDIDVAKQCALIAVDLHLEELDKMKLIFSDREIHYKYWQEVKQEIEKL